MRRLINMCKIAYKFITCKHDFVLLGTTEYRGETRMVCKCEKCSIAIRADVEQMNFLLRKYGVRIGD